MNLKEYLEQISTKILDYIYPTVCGICGKLCDEQICKKCEINLIRKINVGIDDYTFDSEKYFDEHIYIFSYHGIMRDKILEYKFKEKNYLYKMFSKIIINNKKICEKIEDYDIIIPVPIHKNRNLERGYNQCELIAKQISKQTGIDLNSNGLEKIKNIVAQSTLTREKREENTKNAYICTNEELIKNKNILIFDDVYTTGSTVNECSKVLKCAGAKNIGILTIFKT